MTPSPHIEEGLGICCGWCPHYSPGENLCSITGYLATYGLICRPWLRERLRCLRGAEAELGVYREVVAEALRQIGYERDTAVEAVLSGAADDAAAARILAEGRPA